ncbi:MAG: DUF4381 family protein [Verrucomicrobia bacterium]|nr:DUF4381 family protein [Verrucomicrobiota bacterium]
MQKVTNNLAVFFRIASVLLLLVRPLHAQTPEPPPEEDIRGPRDELIIPQEPKKSPAPWIAAAAVVILVPLAWLAWRKFRRMREGPSAVEKALTSLAVLARGKESMSAEAFAGSAAATLRQYITDRFGIAAPRRTTEEFLSEILVHEEAAIADNAAQLKQFLQSCDLAKFAGGQLNRDQREELIQSARGFVSATHMARVANKASES